MTVGFISQHMADVREKQPRSETMLLFLLPIISCVTISSAVSTFMDDRPLIRQKRLTYYLCGVYPNQYYSSSRTFSSFLLMLPGIDVNGLT
ncbi:hypothetical protein OESDEN_00284 [Oesophagostomum dentatum]|uniref:Uncharacterized protein n=1 Tax=Oesophagostomum dentatum TaxID=61180 RepID=A0A0B1TQC8_OESDE|nr:hypothetical protein OESDEN_00284 [Oesophagostomum dentatum]